MSQKQKIITKRIWNLLCVPLIVSVTWYAGQILSRFFSSEWAHIAIALCCGFSGSYIAIKLWRK